MEMITRAKGHKHRVHCWRVSVLYGVNMLIADENGSSDPYWYVPARARDRAS